MNLTVCSPTMLPPRTTEKPIVPGTRGPTRPWRAYDREILETPAARRRDALAERQCGPRRGVDLVAVVALRDLDVVAVAERLRGTRDEIHEHADSDAEIARVDDRDLVGGLFHRRELAVLEAGRTDHERGAAVDAGAQVRLGRARQREVHGDLGAVQPVPSDRRSVERPARPHRRARPHRGRAACRSAPSPRRRAASRPDSITAPSTARPIRPAAPSTAIFNKVRPPSARKTLSRRRTTSARADYAGNPRSEATRRTRAASASARRSGLRASRPARGRTDRRRRRARTDRTPFPRSLNTLPDCVSAGTLSSTLPSSVGTSTEPPSAAVAKLTGHLAAQVLALALEDRVLADRDVDVEVAGRPAVAPGLALAATAGCGRRCRRRPAL